MTANEPRSDVKRRAALAFATAMGHDASALDAVPRQGSVNWTFRASLGPMQYAVRINRSRTIADAFAEYTKERWCMEAARRCGIPAPSVVHVGLSAVCAWSIQEWIDGTRAPNTPETYRVLGDYARRLAQHTVTPPLGMFADANVDWRAQVQYNINQLTPHDPLIQLNVYATHAQTLVRDAFVMLGHHKFAVGLDHGDLTPRNVIARSNGTAVLIDWGCATYDVCPFAALARVYAARALHNTPSVTGAAAFVDGCGVASNFAVNMLPRVRAWAVLKAVDLVRWAIDRCPERVAETSDIARRIVATAIRTPS